MIYKMLDSNSFKKFLEWLKTKIGKVKNSDITESKTRYVALFDTADTEAEAKTTRGLRLKDNLTVTESGVLTGEQTLVIGHFSNTKGYSSGKVELYKGTFPTTIVTSGFTANTVTLPDADGVLALSSQIPIVSAVGLSGSYSDLTDKPTLADFVLCTQATLANDIDLNDFSDGKLYFIGGTVTGITVKNFPLDDTAMTGYVLTIVGRVNSYKKQFFLRHTGSANNVANSQIFFRTYTTSWSSWHTISVDADDRITKLEQAVISLGGVL